MAKVTKEQLKAGLVQAQAGLEKEGKRVLTWQGIMENRQVGKDQEGNKISGFLTGENMAHRYIKDGRSMASHWPGRVLGYNINTEGELLKDKDSNFKRVTGISIKDFLTLQEQEKYGNNGWVFNFSLGGYSNHYIFLVPGKGKEITLTLHNGQKTTITQDTILHHNNYFIITNHGRAQHMAYFLAYQLKLFTGSLGKAKGKGALQYRRSTSTQLNLIKEQDTFYYQTKNGANKPIPTDNPYQLLLTGLEKGRDFLQDLATGKKLDKYLKI